MKPRSIAIIGGGLSGLTLARDLVRRGFGGEITLFEQADRLGGIIETVHHDGFVIECGPDAWVTEKPWARELVSELGLEHELLPSHDATRKTYILQHGRLTAMPDGMRLMVPADLDAAARSPLFSSRALTAFKEEIARASTLRATATTHDESVASFVGRHFGSEVLESVAAPLLSGVFGGDVRRLSARAVLPQLVALEQRYGSLIVGLQQQLKAQSAADNRGEAQRDRRPPSIFTTLRRGMGTLVDAVSAEIPSGRVRKNTTVLSLERRSEQWLLHLARTRSSRMTADEPPSRQSVATDQESFDAVVLATSWNSTRRLLTDVDPGAAALLPAYASSAMTIAFAWTDTRLRERDRHRTGCDRFAPPPGFGFLVPPRRGVVAPFGPQILAATFADQKFSGRAPSHGKLLRVFYGGPAAERLWHLPDHRLCARALDELRRILGPLPAASPFTVLRRWRNSLPQYEVGHLARVQELEGRVRVYPGLHLLGNALHGVGLPDLIRDARALSATLTS